MVPRAQTVEMPLDNGSGYAGGEVGLLARVRVNPPVEHSIEGRIPVFARKFHKRHSADEVLEDLAKSPVVCVELEIGGKAETFAWAASACLAGFRAAPMPSDEQLAIGAISSGGNGRDVSLPLGSFMPGTDVEISPSIEPMSVASLPIHWLSRSAPAVTTSCAPVPLVQACIERMLWASRLLASRLRWLYTCDVEAAEDPQDQGGSG